MSHFRSGHISALSRWAADDTHAGPAPLFWLYLPLAAAASLAVMAQVVPEFYANYMEPEIGILESFHIVEGLAGAVIALTLLARPEVRARGWLLAWVTLAFLGCAYVAGEEASWGQHFFAWTTPEEWRLYNDQGETNLHNISSWLDQKPRLLLEIGVLVGGLVFPLIQRGGRFLQRGRLAYLTPSIVCLPTAAMALLVRLEDVVIEVTDAPMLLFHRPSEVQELFFYYFVCLYLAVLSRRIRSAAPPA